MPSDFWDHPPLRAAFATRHIGKVIREYRRHPHHGRRPLPQEVVGEWLDITQAQVSRIEGSAPIVHLDRLIQLARLFGIPESHLWFTLPDSDDQTRTTQNASTRIEAVVASTHETELGDTQPGVPSPWLSAKEFEMAAEESARFVRHAARVVSVEVIEQLDDDVEWMAREYLRRPPYALFRALAGLRSEVFGMIDTRPHPRHLTDLYRVAGRLTGLLAHASSDLGQAHAAESHARSALLCANYAGDASLESYVRWVQSNTAYWRGQFTAATELAETGLERATTGNDVLRLASQQARAHAAAGQHRECETALGRAGEARDRLSSEPSPGGVFHFPLGKAAYYASEIRQDLGGSDNARRAVAEANEALVLLDQDPETRQAPELYAATRLDLVAAHLSLGELDAATPHTESVLELPAENRTVPIIGRMATTYRKLKSAPFESAAVAQDLCDRIETFTAYPAARELPA